ncbi:MAG: hypothetical protein GEV03_15635 [Streptosporangiales bacterium]|nr:hypothetical protein [Streptosporangiales bacterium]
MLARLRAIRAEGGYEWWVRRTRWLKEAEASMQDVLDQLEVLRRQNEQLRAEVAGLREYVTAEAAPPTQRD